MVYYTYEIRMVKSAKLKHKGVTWELITKPSKKDLYAQLETYGFHDLHIQACLPPIQRPRLESCEHYLFMILTFPMYDQKTHRMDHVEIDFFVNATQVITIIDRKYAPIQELFSRFETDAKFRNNAWKSNPGYIIYEILNAALRNSFPHLNEINLSIEKIEHQLFSGLNRGMIKEILNVMHNIVDFRKSMIAHKSVIRKFLDKSPEFFKTNGLKTYFDDLILNTKEIWDTLDNYKDTMAALQSSHDSLYQWRLNEVIKTLTIFSVVIFSITFTAAIFAVANQNGMPFMDTPFSFWKTLGVIVIVGVSVFTLFKRKRWI